MELAMLDFIKPNPNDLLISAFQSVWALYARLTSTHIRIEISNADIEKIETLANQRGLICPNHSDHADPLVLFGLSAKCKQHFAYLTAREIFKRYPSVSALWLQALGCYSVVRAAPDIESYRTSLRLLLDNRAKVVMFPEGEVSHQNMRLSHLEDGPEQVALSTALNLLNQARDQPVWIIPVGLLYRYEHAITNPALELLERIEAKLQISQRCVCVPHRLKSCFESWMRTLSVPHSQTTPDFQTLKAILMTKTISRLPFSEFAHLANTDPSLENIHKLRNLLNEKCIEGLSAVSEQDRTYYRKLKTITKLHAIDACSFDHSLTQEEVGELLFVLEEEILRTTSIQADRVCYISVDEPIDARDFRAEFLRNKKAAVVTCKTRLEDGIRHAVQSLAEKHQSLAKFPLCCRQ